jgi:hypothetical protein
MAVLAIGMHFRRGLSILCQCPEFEQYFIRSQGAIGGANPSYASEMKKKK